AIINFSTSVTRLQIPGYGAYAASKGAVEAITLILARELRGRDVTVNAVAPGPTATPLLFEGKTQQMIDHIANTNPMERLGTPDVMADMVTSLAGPGRWVNGQVLNVNGGAACRSASSLRAAPHRAVLQVMPVDAFYGEVVRRITPWQRPAPRLRKQVQDDSSETGSILDRDDFALQTGGH